MKKSFQIDDVFRIEFLLKNKIGLIQSNFFICLNDINQAVWKLDFSSPPVSKYFNNDKFNFSLNTSIYQFDISKGQIITDLNLDFYPETIDENLIIGSRFGKLFTYDCIQKETILNNKYDGNIIGIIKSTVFIANKSFLISQLALTKASLWQKNLNELLDSSEVSIYANLLHVIGDKLFLFAYDPNWENYATLCLDINTGELIKRIEMGAYLYKHNDAIYTVNGQFINQLDPETFEIKSVDLSSQLKDNNLIIDGEHSFFFGDKLYFAAKPGDRAIRSVLGVLDLNNHQLLETKELLINPEQPATNDNRYQIEEIKANDKLVAVNTAGGTLHVFEVER